MLRTLTVIVPALFLTACKGGGEIDSGETAYALRATAGTDGSIAGWLLLPLAAVGLAGARPTWPVNRPTKAICGCASNL